MKIRLNEDPEIVRTVKEGLAARGGYCPCRTVETRTPSVCAGNSASRSRIRISRATATVCCTTRRSNHAATGKNSAGLPCAGSPRPIGTARDGGGADPILYRRRTDMFRSPADAIVMFVCPAVFPMLAYPLARLIPALRRRGREAERRLAMLLSAVGYAAACVYGFAAACGRDPMLVFMTYFLSVVGLLICNRLLRFRASGHSCAVTGPILLACRFLFEPDRLALSRRCFSPRCCSGGYSLGIPAPAATYRRAVAGRRRCLHRCHGCLPADLSLISVRNRNRAALASRPVSISHTLPWQRKLCNSGLFGFPNTSSGVPASSIPPFAMKITRSATLRANSISCVTTTMVLSWDFSPRITDSTSLVSSGSSAEVGSSKHRMSGASASARAMATRCCCPPDSCPG